MVANLISKSDGFYCSNCMVRQSKIPPRCTFCGYWFSNWEEVSYRLVMEEIEEEQRENESNIFGTN